MKIESVAISSLVYDPNNARKHSQKNLDAIKGSLTKFGQQKPIVISTKGVVVAGNGTLEAAHALGWDKINIVRTKLEGADALAFALADNRSAELAEWDTDTLTETLKGLKELDFDIEAIGFDDSFLTIEPSAGLTDPDAVPENVETRCKPGDLWLLGNHRVMCGDSTNVQHVERLMGGEKADICFTSPPYNVGKSLRGNFYKNDDDNKDDYVSFLNDFTALALGFSKFVFVNIQALSANWTDVFVWQNNFLSKLKDVFIWNKKQCPPNIQRGSFNTKFEFVYCFTDEKTNGRNFPCKWQGKYPNVVETESNSGNEYAADHKAGFPVAFPLWFLEKLDFVNGVYEPFCGTGTTLIACEKTARKCYGMEIDPHYCDVILKRYEDFTGNKATLETKN